MIQQFSIDIETLIFEQGATVCATYGSKVTRLKNGSMKTNNGSLPVLRRFSNRSKVRSSPNFLESM